MNYLLGIVAFLMVALLFSALEGSFAAFAIVGVALGLMIIVSYQLLDHESDEHSDHSVVEG